MLLSLAFLITVVSCAYPNVAYIPETPSGVKVNAGCPGNDEYITVADGGASIELHASELSGNYVVIVSASLDPFGTIDWREATLRDIGTGDSYRAEKAEKVWYSNAEDFFGPKFNTEAVTAPIEFQTATFYLHFPGRLLDSSQLEFVVPAIEIGADAKGKSSGRLAPRKFVISRVKRWEPFTINC